MYTWIMSIIGIDEVGRGCWAGPLVAAAVKLSSEQMIDGLNDSKLLSAKKRNDLTTKIKNTTDQIGIGWVSPQEINKLGLTESVRLAMDRAVRLLEVAPTDQIIIDGNIDYLSLPSSKAVVKADGSVSAVSAASIIAKVARDGYMAELAKEYPQYGFEKHVGYGTRLHIEALELHGVLEHVHRLNYKPIKVFVGG